MHDVLIEKFELPFLSISIQYLQLEILTSPMVYVFNLQNKKTNLYTSILKMLQLRLNSTRKHRRP